MGTGWVGGGVYPIPSWLLEERCLTAKRAPEALQGLEWVVRQLGRPLHPDPPTPDPWSSGARSAGLGLLPGQ